MKLSKALDQKLIRLVPKKETSDYPQPYSKIEKWENWRDHKDEVMTIINIKRQFIFLKKADVLKTPEIMDQTLSFPSRSRAIVYIGEQDIRSLPYTIKANDWMKIKITDEVLNANIASLSELGLEEMSLTHALHLIIKTGNFNDLSAANLIGLICDPDTYKVLNKDNIHNLIQEACDRFDSDILFGDLSEIAGQNTERSRNLFLERQYNIDVPESYNLFGSSKILKLGTVFSHGN